MASSRTPCQSPLPTRRATHARSWYTDDAADLAAQLDEWLLATATAPGWPHESALPNEVPDAPGSRSPPPTRGQPVRGARLVIAPHAGYSYSGATAAWSYAALDLTAARRVYVLGPAHHIYLRGAALSSCGTIATPLGNLHVDRAAVRRLADSGHFTMLSVQDDEDEHSLEMQYPYLAHLNPDLAIVPILVGQLSSDQERVYGSLIADVLDHDPHAVVVISSDFCHFGSRFKYQYYTPSPPPPCACAHPRALHKPMDVREMHTHLARHASHAPAAPDTSYLDKNDAPHVAGEPEVPVQRPATVARDITVAMATKGAVPIHESIEALDRRAIHLIERLDADGFRAYLAETKNTICGRNPIAIALAALRDLYDRALETILIETLAASRGDLPIVRLLCYAQSSKVVRVNDSSVSYVAAYAYVPRFLAPDEAAPDVDDIPEDEPEEREVLRNDEDEPMAEAEAGDDGEDAIEME
ncbi:hypothetical protein AMAG_04712 [Allomyces macrogynus ATCC 38327]|uniref:AmmeMemoRadiSam system protein B n=1 Tax=Allomyces macrogynus (strain ATCC 38327) TaxID=578462 RepID=A0A0L0S5T7_ALLM3|nr:hypothetical protein AMAG_04712 [Allomyces macrogynus ATCC 38327]|eukprot:KNE57867.1 hypothetical protein AMAG_04712 [Allomyces macrogynus ATCC 38327]